MSNQNRNTQTPQSDAPRPNTARSNSTNPLISVLKAIASLKLTVALLSFALFGVLTATLQLAWADIWTVKKMHFPNPMEFESFSDWGKFFVYIPFQTYFIPAWFPKSQDIGGGFYLPAGVLVIALMMINLTAAHLIRFRLQATGMRLALGVGATLLGIVTAFAIVSLGQNQAGVQGEPVINDTTMGGIVTSAIGFLAVVCAVPIFTLDNSRWLEKITAGAGAALFVGIFIFMLMLGKSYLIEGEGARIVWLMAQGLCAGLILLAGCILLFKRKGAVVLIHAGMMLLMAGELFTTYTAVESQIDLQEGQSKDYSHDIRFFELAVVDITEKTHWDEVIIPGWMLSNERPSSRVSHDELPFDIVVGQFYQNSKLELSEKQLEMERRPRRSDFLKVTELAPVTGATSSGIDNATVELLIVPEGSADEDETPEMIAKILASQAQLPKAMSDALNESALVENIDYKDRTYRVYLRFRRIYKPYEIRLLDTDRQLYVGTTKPRSFTSEFEIIDHRFGTTTKHKISMNNPLRYGNETFYQQQYDVIGGVEFSGIQIVHNRGWMIPYASCMIVGIGLIAHFVLALFAFLKRLATKMNRSREVVAAEAVADLAKDDKDKNPFDVKNGNKSKPPAKVVAGQPLAQPGSAKPQSAMVTFTLPLVVALLFGLYSSYKMVPTTQTTDSGIVLNQFGQLPVTCNGRTMPLDSLARNLARKYSNYEKLKDGEGNTQPAIKWLADVMFEAPGHKEYELFRIDEPSLQYELGLKRRKGFRYTAAEIESNFENFEKLVREAESKKSIDQSIMDKRAIALMIDWREYKAMYRALTEPVKVVDPETGFNRIGDAMLELTSGAELPLLLQTDTREDERWIARSKWANLKWFASICDEYDINGLNNQRNIERVGNVLLNEYLAKHMKQLRLQTVTDEQIEDEVNARLARELLAHPLMKNAQDTMSAEQFKEFSGGVMQNPPAEFAAFIAEKQKSITQEVKQLVENQVDLLVSQQISEISGQVLSMVAATVGLENPVNVTYEENKFEQTLAKIKEAYLSDDAEAFAETVKTYDALATDEPAYSINQSYAEWYYNSTSPWFIAMVLYLIAFIVLAFSWAVNPHVFSRAGLGILLVALLLHLVAIVFRVYISGRAPVTNLYSSAVFIGFISATAFVSLEYFVKMGISLALAAVSGFASLMIAFNLSTSGDTFTVMQAVLDTNFWLSTHVVCISIGYSATLIAGLLGCAYVIGSVITPVFNQENVRKGTINAIYGMTCYAMIFSFVGTVLGGLWADDSWGRFWGWDPKENGALMIVLANALLLHARWCGVAKDRGIAVLAIVGNIVTLWSWFAVNEMGIGLHSYGFTEGTMQKLSYFWLSQLILIGLACIPYRYWVSRRFEAT